MEVQLRVQNNGTPQERPKSLSDSIGWTFQDLICIPEADEIDYSYPDLLMFMENMNKHAQALVIY